MLEKGPMALANSCISFGSMVVLLRYNVRSNGQSAQVQCAMTVVPVSVWLTTRLQVVACEFEPAQTVPAICTLCS